jgi:hypothetical protein
MSVLLKPVSFGWKALDRALNLIIDAVNRNAPLEGDGISLDEKGLQGVSINLSSSNGNKPDPNNPQQASSGSGDLVAVTIQAFDLNNNPVSLTVMVPAANSGFGDSTLRWQPVVTVDSVTCASGTIPLLGQVPQ